MKKISFGLPVEIDEQTGKLTFGEEVLCQKTAAKTFAGMKHLAYDEHEAPDDHVCYVFYQNIWRKADAPLFEKTKITNGITVLMPGLMGHECHKNSGHYHSVESHCEPLPEIYEVLCGKAVFLLQQTHDFLDESKPLPVERFQAVFAGEGSHYAYALGRADGQDIGALVKAMNAALRGRGGGRNGFAQGSVEAERSAVEAFFKER